MNNMDNIKEFVGNIKNEVISFNDKYKEIDNKINENIRTKSKLTKEVEDVKNKFVEEEYNYIAGTGAIDNQLKEIEDSIKEINEEITNEMKNNSSSANVDDEEFSKNIEKKQKQVDKLYREKNKLAKQKNELTRDFDIKSRNLHIELDRAVAASNDEELIRDQQTLETEKIELFKKHRDIINEIETNINEKIDECDKALENFKRHYDNAGEPYSESIKSYFANRITEVENNKRILNEVIKFNLLDNYKIAFELLPNNADTYVLNSLNDIADLLSDVEEKIDDTIIEKIQNVSDKIYATENVISITKNNGKIEYSYKNIKSPEVYYYSNYDTLINRIQTTEKDYLFKKFTVINRINNEKNVANFNDLNRFVNILPIANTNKEEIVEEEKNESVIEENQSNEEVLTEESALSENDKKIADFKNALKENATHFDYNDTYNLVKNNINDEVLRNLCIDEIKARVNELEDFMLDDTISLDDIDYECKKIIRDYSDIPELADTIEKYKNIRNRIKEILANNEKESEVADIDEPALDAQQPVENPTEETTVEEQSVEPVSEETAEVTPAEHETNAEVPDIEDLDETPENQNENDIVQSEQPQTTEESNQNRNSQNDGRIKIVKADPVNFNITFKDALNGENRGVKWGSVAAGATCAWLAAGVLLLPVQPVLFGLGAGAAIFTATPFVNLIKNYDDLIYQKNKLQEEADLQATAQANHKSIDFIKDYLKSKEERKEYEKINSLSGFSKRLNRIFKTSKSYVKASIVADRIQRVCDKANAAIEHYENKNNISTKERISFYVNPYDKTDAQGNMIEPKSACFIKESYDPETQATTYTKLEGLELSRFYEKYHNVFDINDMLHKEFDEKIQNIKGKERNGFRNRTKFNSKFYDEVVNKWNNEGVQVVTANNLLDAFRLCDGLIEKNIPVVENVISEQPVQEQPIVTPAEQIIENQTEQVIEAPSEEVIETPVEETTVEETATEEVAETETVAEETDSPVIEENTTSVTESIDDAPVVQPTPVQAVSEVPEIQDISVIQPINNNQDDFDVELNSSNNHYDLQDIMDDLDNAQSVESIAGLDEITEEEINDEELANVAAKKLIKDNKENK